MTPEQRDFIAGIKKLPPRRTMEMFFKGRSIRDTAYLLNLTEKSVKNYRHRYQQKMKELGIWERVSKPKQRWLEKQARLERERIQADVDLLIKHFDTYPNVAVAEFTWQGEQWRITTKGILAKTEMVNLLSIFGLYDATYTINGVEGPISRGKLSPKMNKNARGLVSKLDDEGKPKEKWDLELDKEGWPIYH